MRFLRIDQVMQLTALSRMTIYRLEIAGQFPTRRRLSGNSVAWLESDVETWASNPSRSCVAARRPSVSSRAQDNGGRKRKSTGPNHRSDRSHRDAVG